MTITKYYNLAMEQKENWLLGCLADPSPAMRSVHIAIIKLAIRNKLR